MIEEQLDLFRQPLDPVADSYTDPDPEPQPQPSTPPRRSQLTELPGTTFEDIFTGPPSRTRGAP